MAIVFSDLSLAEGERLVSAMKYPIASERLVDALDLLTAVERRWESSAGDVIDTLRSLHAPGREIAVRLTGTLQSFDGEVRIADCALETQDEERLPNLTFCEGDDGIELTLEWTHFGPNDRHLAWEQMDAALSCLSVELPDRFTGVPEDNEIRADLTSRINAYVEPLVPPLTPDALSMPQTEVLVPHSISWRNGSKAFFKTMARELGTDVSGDCTFAAIQALAEAAVIEGTSLNLVPLKSFLAANQSCTVHFFAAATLGGDIDPTDARAQMEHTVDDGWSFRIHAFPATPVPVTFDISADRRIEDYEGSRVAVSTPSFCVDWGEQFDDPHGEARARLIARMLSSILDRTISPRKLIEPAGSGQVETEKKIACGSLELVVGRERIGVPMRPPAE